MPESKSGALTNLATPQCEASIRQVVERVLLEALRHEPAHCLRQLRLQGPRFAFALQPGENAGPGTCHARLRTTAFQPRETRRYLGVPAHYDRLKIVVSLPRKKGRYCESFPPGSQRIREGFLRGNRYLRRQHQVPGGRQLERLQPLANPLAEGVAAEEKKRHVGAQLKTDVLQRLPFQLQIPQRVQDQQHRRGVGGAAAQAAADWKILFQLQVATLARAGFFLQQPGGPDAQILVPENAGKPDFAVLARRDANPVGAVDEPDHGLQLVVAVVPPAENVQEEVEFSRRRVEASFHSEIASRGSMPG